MTPTQFETHDRELDAAGRVADRAHAVLHAVHALLERPDGELPDAEFVDLAGRLIKAAGKLRERHEDMVVVAGAYLAECRANTNQP